MMLKEFEYLRPQSLEECLNLLQVHSNAKILAGGTNLIVGMKDGIFAPEVLVDLAGLSELRTIIVNPEGQSTIGSLVTMTELANACHQVKAFSALETAAEGMGSALIRNRGTIGGNVVNASPAADTAAPLLVSRTRVVIASSDGQRAVPLEDFFSGPGKVNLNPSEIVLFFEIPAVPPLCGESYQKLGVRKALQIAIVGVAARITMNPEKGVIDSAYLALSSVGPKPLLVTGVERFLIGNEPSEKLFSEVAGLAVAASRPINDLRATADYQLSMVGELTKRALSDACQQALVKSKVKLETKA